MHPDFLKTVGGRIGLAAMMLAGLSVDARADAVADWAARAGETLHEARMGTPPAVRVMAIVQTAVGSAVESLPPARGGQPAAPAVDAAVAAANRVVLTRLVPSQEAAVAKAYQAAIDAIADEKGKAAGIAAGEAAAAKVLAARADDGAGAPDRYKPHAQAGTYVPTAAPAVPQWPQRRPWLMASPSQFRPAPPPALTSPLWVRDFDEVKAIGGKVSSRRSAEQTEIARFWDYSLPGIYLGVVRSVALSPGHDPVRNARLYATVAQAMDDALIAVFDAKYTYNFWRPATAVRNGDVDGNDATEADPTWSPLSDTPMHPEYPSAHSILASSVATVLRADLAGAATPELSTASPSAKGAVRRWTSLDDFVAEVSVARIYEGVHFRHSTEIGVEMGRKIGALAAKRLAPAPY